jgi:hypothetical protein
MEKTGSVGFDSKEIERSRRDDGLNKNKNTLSSSKHNTRLVEVK